MEQTKIETNRLNERDKYVGRLWVERYTFFLSLFLRKWGGDVSSMLSQGI